MVKLQQTLKASMKVFVGRFFRLFVEFEFGGEKPKSLPPPREEDGATS